MNINIETTKEWLEKIYPLMEGKLKKVNARLNRKYTLAEKILFSHLDSPEGQELKPGESILALRPDRVAMQDATAQMALLQFLSSGKNQTAVPTTVHCDHLIRAYHGASSDLNTAVTENREVYDFLKTASAHCGIGFWNPGSGIIHQVVLEQYAFPGGLMIGTDSHTPNAGGLGMLAIGVGGMDAVDAMAGFPWEVKYPKLIGVKLTGAMSGWTAPKDIICHLLGILTVKGGTNRIIEYFGPGTSSISCTGKGTITNMGAELGATTSVFPFDERMEIYLKATRRGDLLEVARKYRHLLSADPEVENNPEKYYDEVIEIQLDKLEPQVVGPHSPDRARPISKMASDVAQYGWPDKMTYSLIGSCTNSSYEDISRAVDVARQAKEHGMKMPVPLLVSPGSEQIFQTIQRDGQIDELQAIGATVLANACGPCIGQWKRDDIKKGDVNTILNSFNRNFPARNDGNPDTLSFIASPEMVIGIALGGRLSFNPLRDELTAPNGTKFKLVPPKKAPEIPEKGFIEARQGYVAPSASGSGIEVSVAPDSKRLQLLKPFQKWNGNDFEKLPLLMKIKGKCTTDHISPAGIWLKYRGHLDNISDNMLTGAINAFTNEPGKTKNLLTGESGQSTPHVARSYKANGLPWIVVGDENYGEGSSREHAAMSPRFLGCVAIITKGFARIHETNLKKQGILPLTFSNPSDYDKVKETDRISIRDLKNLAPGKAVVAVLHHFDENNMNETASVKEEQITLKHSMTDEQIQWFKAGSALNLIAGR